MLDKYPHVSIFLLNWNHWRDTLECLESVLKSDYPNYTIILIDNDSHNDSIEKIKTWASGNLDEKIQTDYESLVYPLVEKPVHMAEMTVEDQDPDVSQIPVDQYSAKIILLKSRTNFGFAVGNNICYAVAKKIYNSKYYYLLNNDTVIRPDTVSELVKCLEDRSELGAAQSTIYYYKHSDLIANAGGRIVFWGQSKYYTQIEPGSVKEISFINGCALCVKSEVVNKLGLLSEKFFFMEDDFEYSMRLNRNNIRKVSVADSHVFHKIGVCADEMFENPAKRVMLFALSRMVDLRQYYPGFIWKIWKYLAMGYFFGLMIFRYKVKLRKAISAIGSMAYYSSKIKDVKKETWEKILEGTSDW